MAIKVYLKKGNLNYKERKYISALQKTLESKGIDGKKFNPATNFGELEQLYNEYCIDDVAFEEVKNEKGTSNAEGTDNGGDASIYDQHKEFVKDGLKSVEPVEEFGDNAFIDPFNSAEPIVREYVKDNGFQDPSQEKQQTKTSFDEPTSWGDSFQLPNGEEKGGSGNGGGNGGGNSGGDKRTLGGGNNNNKGKDKNAKSEPLNPALDGISDAKKRKSTKKMAKAIVFGVCKLAEYGCVWWVTKDITEDKLIEYEINDTMDLQVLLTLDENQQITVRNWFSLQVKTANEILKISEEDKNDLADSLYEVMLEKGIAPTPMQELIINAVSTIVIGLGVKAFAMQQQVNSVLGQLMLMRKEQKEGQERERETKDEFDRQEKEEEKHYEETMKKAEKVSINEDDGIEYVETEEVNTLTRIE
jgi:hypothetical protein